MDISDRIRPRNLIYFWNNFLWHVSPFQYLKCWDSFFHVVNSKQTNVWRDVWWERSGGAAGLCKASFFEMQLRFASGINCWWCIGTLRNSWGSGGREVMEQQDSYKTPFAALDLKKTGLHRVWRLYLLNTIQALRRNSISSHVNSAAKSWRNGKQVWISK